MIMLVSLNASFSILNIKAIIFHQTENTLIDRKTMISNNNSAMERHILRKFTPLMTLNLLDIKSFSRVNI